MATNRKLLPKQHLTIFSGHAVFTDLNWTALWLHRTEMGKLALGMDWMCCVCTADCSKKLPTKGKYQRLLTDLAHVQVNLFFQKASRHYAIKATKLLFSSRGNQASCAAFCWWLICALPQWKGEGGKENIMLIFWQTFSPADIKLLTAGKYYYRFIDYNNKSWVTKHISGSGRVKMQVSRLLVFWLSHSPMMSISSDINLPSRNAGRLNPLDHVSPVSNEKELCHVSVQVPIHKQSCLIIWQTAENSPVRFSDSHKETASTWNLKLTHPFSITEHILPSLVKGYSKCYLAPNFLAADTQHTAAYSSLTPHGRELRATFPPGKGVCICCSQCATAASTGAGPQTPADHTHTVSSA